MTNAQGRAIALHRFSVISPLVNTPPARGQLQMRLRELSSHPVVTPDGRYRKIPLKTIQRWYYDYRDGGLDALLPRSRKDRGKTRVLTLELQQLILDMKREDPGRSAALIHRELEATGRLQRASVSVSTIQRLIRREGLMAPPGIVQRRERLRWQASECGQLWQGDCVHGPKLFDPRAGREVRVKIFGLLDDKSRLITYARAAFRETQEAFLRVLQTAVLRRGLPRALYLDNHGSFTGSDVEWACAKLGIRLLFTRPYDGASKGKIERAWRTLRAGCLDRLDMDKVRTLDDLNLRLMAWIENAYNNKPHAGLAGASPLEVWETDADLIRWVDDPREIEQAFIGQLERKIRNDGTCQVYGKWYEVPAHLRRKTIPIHYALLHPDRFWTFDGAARVPLREVEPIANARRTRRIPHTPDAETRPVTGLNNVEDLLNRAIRPPADGPDDTLSTKEVS